MAEILVVEDEAVIRRAVRRLLERHGHSVCEAGSVAEAEAAGLAGRQLILADVRLPGAPGTELIGRAAPVPVIVMTSYATVPAAVEAIKQGAVDYIAKPFDHGELMLLIERVLGQHRAARTRAALQSEVDRSYPVEGMVGECEAMKQVCERIGKVAPTDATVLVLGESGTGKELVARAIHARSARCDGPFVTVNCAAIPEGLIESELFGHAEGALANTGQGRVGLVESADGGTLFLDEVGELPQAAQARLLRVIQDGEVRRVGGEATRRVDVRLLAATHRDLRRAVQQATFREDLYFRLRVVELQLPPLRERGDDIPRLAAFLLDKVCRQLNRPLVSLDDSALRAIARHNWPGNVRELENALERAVILCEPEGSIDAALLGIEHLPGVPADVAPALSLEDYFRQFVLEHQGRMTETELARRLGISRKTLWERRQRFSIPRPGKGG